MSHRHINVVMKTHTLNAKNAKLPAPAKKQNTSNMAMFCAAVTPIPPMIEIIEQYNSALLRPKRSEISQPHMMPITAPT